MPDKLYLPPGLTNAGFIKVGDDCYEKVDETDLPPTVNVIDGEFKSCDCTGECCPSENECTHCDDVTPIQYEVTFNSVSLCSCTASTGYGEDAKFEWVAGDVLNTAHVVTQTGTNCVWTKTLADAVRWYGSTDCSFDYGTRDVFIQLERKASTWLLEVYATMFMGSGPGAGMLFRAEVNETAVGVCAALPEFTPNATTAKGCGANESTWVSAPNVMATDGSASVECVNTDCDACVACDPDGIGADPSNADITIDSDCLDFSSPDNVNPIPYFGFNVATSSAWCLWTWLTGIDNQIHVYLYYIKIDGASVAPPVGLGTCTNITADEGEWVIGFFTNEFQGDVDEGEWFEKTTGFACDVTTGKVSGSHTFTTQCHGLNDCIGVMPTVTVPA